MKSFMNEVFSNNFEYHLYFRLLCSYSFNEQQKEKYYLYIYNQDKKNFQNLSKFMNSITRH